MATSFSEVDAVSQTITSMEDQITTMTNFTTEHAAALQTTSGVLTFLAQAMGKQAKSVDAQLSGVQKVSKAVETAAVAQGKMLNLQLRQLATFSSAVDRNSAYFATMRVLSDMRLCCCCILPEM